jgi:hypothetical protein
MTKKSATATATKPKPRIQVVVSHRQREILSQIAARSGSDLSTWMLAHAFRAVAHEEGLAEIPMVISGTLADRIRALADGQGISTDKLLEQFVITRSVA